MVNDLCRMAGAVWWMDGKELVVKLRSEIQSSVVTLESDTGLRRFSARFSAMDQTTDVTVRGWDMTKKQAVVGKKASRDVTKATTAPIVTAVEGAHNATSWPHQVVGSSDAEMIATGIAQRMNASVVSGRGECDVAAMVRPGCTITIANVSTQWNGDYYVTAAEHIFGNGQPFITRFVTGTTEDDSLPGLLGGSTGPSGAALGSGLTIGIVTNNKDSSDSGNDVDTNRVRVKFPYLSDEIESAWARVVSPGAGKGRGLMILPEIDDEVLVGFEHGDLRRPYVLGGLWNGTDKPPLASGEPKLLQGNKVVTKSFTSRKGHVISIADGNTDDDDLIVVSLAGEHGTLSLAHDAVALYHGQDVDLTITTSSASIELRKGGDINIKGKNIKLEAQSDITLSGQNLKIDAKSGIEATANAQVKLSGTGGVQVRSSGMVEIAGTMVKVN